MKFEEYMRQQIEKILKGEPIDRKAPLESMGGNGCPFARRVVSSSIGPTGSPEVVGCEHGRLYGSNKARCRSGEGPASYADLHV